MTESAAVYPHVSFRKLVLVRAWTVMQEHSKALLLGILLLAALGAIFEISRVLAFASYSLSVGYVHLTLAAARGHKPRVSSGLSALAPSKLVPAVVLGVINTVAIVATVYALSLTGSYLFEGADTTFGYAVLFVIVLATFFVGISIDTVLAPSLFILVDRRTNSWNALRLSWNMIKGRFSDWASLIAALALGLGLTLAFISWVSISAFGAFGFFLIVPSLLLGCLYLQVTLAVAYELSLNHETAETGAAVEVGTGSREEDSSSPSAKETESTFGGGVWGWRMGRFAFGLVVLISLFQAFSGSSSDPVSVAQIEASSTEYSASPQNESTTQVLSAVQTEALPVEQPAAHPEVFPREAEATTSAAEYPTPIAAAEPEPGMLVFKKLYVGMSLREAAAVLDEAIEFDIVTKDRQFDGDTSPTPTYLLNAKVGDSSITTSEVWFYNGKVVWGSTFVTNRLLRDLLDREVSSGDSLSRTLTSALKTDLSTFILKVEDGNKSLWLNQLIEVKADASETVHSIRVEPELTSAWFNAGHLGAEEFVQTFIDSYGIPSMEADTQVTHNPFWNSVTSKTTWSHLSGSGYRLYIDSEKAIGVYSVAKASDLAFD